MYEAFFDLQKRPFPTAPDPDCFVPVGDAAAALADLTHCVRESRGIGVVTAAAGLGKTLLCRALAGALESEWAVAWLPNGSFPSRRALLQAILFELGHPYAKLSESEMRLTLAAAARDGRPQCRGVAILIDEAHHLTDKLLEELRGLTNLQDGGQPLFQIVLSGSLELDEMLAAPSRESFRQRVGCQTTLQPLTQGDAAAYLAQRIAWAGGDIETIFTEDAVRLIAHASDGSPRCLNQLADQSMLLASAADERPIGVELVRNALDDLRELPLHWNAPSRFEAPETTDDDTLDADEQASESNAGFDADSPSRAIEPDAAGADSDADVTGARRVDAFALSDDSGEFAAIEIGGASSASTETVIAAVSRSDTATVAKTDNPAEPPTVAIEVIDAPWGERLCRPELLEARSADVAALSAARSAPTGSSSQPTTSLPPGDASSKQAEPIRGESATTNRGAFQSVDDHAGASPAFEARAREVGPAASVSSVSAMSVAADQTTDPVTTAVGASAAAPPVAPAPSAPKPARRSEPRRSRRAARGPRGPLTFVEEVVVDRYALLDAGKAVVGVAEDSDVFGSGGGSDRDIPRRPRPDELIDRIVPMIDAALSLDGGRDTAGSSGPSDVHKALRQAIGGSGGSASGGTGDSNDPSDTETMIAAAALEQSVEVRREVVARLGAEERQAFDATLQAMTEDELRGAPPASPTTLVGSSESSAEPLQTRSSASKQSASGGSRGDTEMRLTESTRQQDAARPPAYDDSASVAPLDEAPAARRYSHLFSALRKKLKRSA